MARRDLKAACTAPCKPPVPRRDLRGHAPLLRALGDEARLEIVARLAAAGGPVCVCDLMPGLGLAQPTVSHHLRVLKEAGVVRWERRGTWVYYALELSIMGALADLLGALAPPALERAAEIVTREAS
jgi:ArsR family transcriptional regulator